MRTYYIPTSSLNFNNILSAESISPKAFYLARSFGYGRWVSIPENPFENSIVLYDELASFSRPSSDYEDHPLLLEVTLDNDQASSLVPLNDHAFLCDHTIYMDPFSSRLLFFSEDDKRVTLSLSDTSIETKFVRLYSKKIGTITPPASSYKPIDAQNEIQPSNTAEIEKDKRINRMKGLLYGYYIGAILSASKEDVVRLNTAREIYNILSAILASVNRKATPQQREKLKFLYTRLQPEVPFLTKLSAIISEKSMFDAVVSLVKEEYGCIRGEFDVDRTLAQLLAGPSYPNAKNSVIENINSIIKQLENHISSNAQPIAVTDNHIIVNHRALVLLQEEGVSEKDNTLCKAWLNDVLSKDGYTGKVSIFKETLSDEITRKAKEVYEPEWKGSHPEITLNALRHHIRGEEYRYTWNNDIYSAISALVIRGDNWQKFLEFMQGKEMTNYRIAFAFYGTLNGFANLPRDFTDILFGRDNKYIAEVYKEFHKQLHGRDILNPRKLYLDESSTKISLKEDIINTNNVTEINPSVTFDSLMTILCKNCKGAKNDKNRYEELFKQYDGLNSSFIDAVATDKHLNKGKKAQKVVLDTLRKLIYRNSITPHKLTNEDLFTDKSLSNGIFLHDYEFLLNNSKFIAMMSEIDCKWQRDLKWFIDAHNPSNENYDKYYKDRSTDNQSVIKQFLGFKNGKYQTEKITSLLNEIYKL